MKEKPISYYLANQCFRHTLNDALKPWWPIRVQDAGSGAGATVEVRQESGQWITVYRAQRLKDAKLWIMGFLAGREMINVDWQL